MYALATAVVFHRVVSWSGKLAILAPFVLTLAVLIAGLFFRVGTFAPQEAAQYNAAGTQPPPIMSVASDATVISGIPVGTIRVNRFA